MIPAHIMTSRDRIIATLNRQPVDRIPIDFGGTRQSGISVWAYAKLREALGGPSHNLPRVYDTYQMLAEVESGIADRFCADCVGLHRPAVAFGVENRDWKAWDLPDGLRVEIPGGFNPEPDGSGGFMLKRGGDIVAAMPGGAFYFDRFEKYPGATHPNLDAWRPPVIAEAILEHTRTESENLFIHTDKAIIAPMGPPYELFNGIGQGGFEDWMITFASEDEYVTDLFGVLTDVWLENLALFHQAVGDRVQIIQICDDFGTQSAPFLSTGMFREKLLPAYKRGLDWIHEHTSWKVMLHSDGAIVPLLPSIIEMGVDILNPVQTSAAGMDPATLKRDFGDQLIFWGGSCDGQSTLTDGTPEQVSAETRQNVAALGMDGGLVCASIHNIQANVPPENIIALFDSISSS
ncbi:MAG: methyltransferase [Verrucomicrobia bacterium]|nr:MAG: methyltransferase [Verrucomicrobiota bacterium]